MTYTAHFENSPQEPPTYVIVGERDDIASPETMERRVSALKQAGVRVRYCKVDGVAHGFGLKTGTHAQGWSAEAARFWQEFRPRAPESR